MCKLVACICIMSSLSACSDYVRVTVNCGKDDSYYGFIDKNQDGDTWTIYDEYNNNTVAIVPKSKCIVDNFGIY